MRGIGSSASCASFAYSLGERQSLVIANYVAADFEMLLGANLGLRQCTYLRKQPLITIYNALALFKE